MNIASNFINSRGFTFQIERNNKIISKSLGLPNHEKATSKPYIGMLEGADVSVGDWLINPHNERFYVVDKVSDYAFNEFQQYKLFYLTETQFENKKSAIATFHIENAYGSVIGTQSSVTLNYNESINKAKEQIKSIDSVDKEELQQIISLLEMVINNQVPMQKGLFSKFSAVMERNSWISGTITSAMLNWLVSQI